MNLADLLNKKRRFVAVFSTPEGKRVLADLLKTCGVGRPSFVRGDTHATAFNEGQRHIGLSLMKFLSANEAELIRRIQQAEEQGNE